MAEEWTAFGISCACLDTSTYIQGNKVGNANLTINNIDISTNQGRTAARALLGTVDWVITEDVLPMLSDAECTALGTRARSVNANVKVAHWVSPSTPSGVESVPTMNWKTLAQWKTLMSPDTIVARGASVAA